MTRSDECFSEMDPDEIIELLGLTPLADEGGMWSQVLLDEYSSAIYYMLAGDDFSALHRLPHPEIYHYYAGSALELLVLNPDGTATRPVLGLDLEGGQRPAVIVPGGTWQGSRPRGVWSLVGTTMAPAFTFDAFELGDRVELQQRYPSEAVEIEALTR